MSEGHGSFGKIQGRSLFDRPLIINVHNFGILVPLTQLLSDVELAFEVREVLFWTFRFEGDQAADKIKYEKKQAASFDQISFRSFVRLLARWKEREEQTLALFVNLTLVHSIDLRALV